MQVGIDIVDINDFERRISRSGDTFLTKMFTPLEISMANASPIHLAGKLCVKESLIKIGLLKVGDWLEAEVLNDFSGKPYVKFNNGQSTDNLAISISHTKTYSVGIAIIN